MNLNIAFSIVIEPEWLCYNETAEKLERQARIMPQGNPQAGEFYLHFKNKLYQVLNIATHSETGEKLVIYQALYGDFKVYARPLSSFISEVDTKKYPEARAIYRFTNVDQTSLVGIQSRMVRDAQSDVTQAEENAKTVTEDTTKFEQVVANEVVTEATTEESKETEMTSAVASAAAEDENAGVSQNLLRFLDTDDFNEKYRILGEMTDEIDDVMLDNLAASIDLVVPDGPIDGRIDHLRYAIRKRLQFENERLR